MVRCRTNRALALSFREFGCKKVEAEEEVLNLCSRRSTSTFSAPGRETAISICLLCSNHPVYFGLFLVGSCAERELATSIDNITARVVISSERTAPAYDNDLTIGRRKMASLLDANLYTLLIRPSPKDPKNLTQLIEPSRGTEVRYLRYRGRLDTSESTPSASRHDSGTEEDPTRAFGGYDASLVDAYTGVCLASCSSSQPSHKAKSRRLELHNPDMVIPFEFSGGL